MVARLSVSLISGVVLALLVGAGAWAQQTPPTATPQSEPATVDPGADEGEAADTAAQRAQQQRRRMVTTTSGQLKIGDKTISLSTGIQKTDGPDYGSIANLESGDVLRLTRSQAIKLKTDFPLVLGDTTLKTENVSEGYAGVYGLWIKKTSDGWSFVFNEQPDLWGTMFDPASAIAEVPVTYTKLTEPTDALKFELPQSGQGGTIKISWGEHEWSVPFTIAE